MTTPNAPGLPISAGSSTTHYGFGRFELQVAERRLLVEGKPIALGSRTLDLLLALVKRAGHLATKNEILDEVWPNLVVEENNLQVQVSALRKVLGNDAIQTVPKGGYRFVLPLTSVSAASATAARTFPAASDGPSIAVLPFANLSDDVANEYFAEGLADELLTVLSRVSGLRVASRTSSSYFKGKDVDLPTIASKLNVRTLLEGSVRRSNRRIRTTVQLIDVVTDSHLWGGNFEREIEDVFAVQDEIAAAIVSALRPKLLGASARPVTAEITQASKGRTTSPEALDLFLQGRQLARLETTVGIKRALSYYEKALAIDTRFAAAWVGAAIMHATSAGYGRSNVGDSFRQARTAVLRALALEPDLANAHAILAWIRLYCDWDWTGAEKSIRRALDLGPNDPSVLRNATIILGNVGCAVEGMATAHRAAILEPLRAKSHLLLGSYQLQAMDLLSAEASLTRALELEPPLALTNFTLGNLRLAQSRMDEALAAFHSEQLEEYRLLGLTLVHHMRGAAAESATALTELIERHSESSPCQIATAYACRTEIDLAFDWLDRAFEKRDPRLVETAGDSLFRNLREDLRWSALLNRMGFPASRIDASPNQPHT